MALSPPHFEDQQTILAAEAHRTARRHEHDRMLWEHESAAQDRKRRVSLGDRVRALLRQWRPGRPRPAVLRIRMVGPLVDDHDLTDEFCRLADGSMGRVAMVLGSDEEWAAVCVRV